MLKPLTTKGKNMKLIKTTYKKSGIMKKNFYNSTEDSKIKTGI